MTTRDGMTSLDFPSDDVATRWVGMMSDAPFEPVAHYDADGDCIEFLTSQESYKAERVDDRLTVYYSRETGEIIGSLIKGVRRLLREITDDCPGFSIEVMDGKIHLQHLISATMWKTPPSIERFRSITYQKVRDAANQSSLAVAIPDLV